MSIPVRALYDCKVRGQLGPNAMCGEVRLGTLECGLKEDCRYQVEKTITGHRPPTAAEVRFGEGATHYKDFPITEWLKPDHSLKKWIKCQYDGLRYYR